MSPALKKMWWVLGLSAAVVAIFFILQTRRTLNIETKTSPEPLLSPIGLAFPPEADEQIFGNPGAPLTVTAFVDLGDRTSQRRLAEVLAVVRAHPREARLVWKDAPFASFLSAPGHERAHLAAWCAGEQNQFWPFVSAIAEERASWREAGLRQTAQDLGLNQTAWQNCLAAPSSTEKLGQKLTLTRSLGLKKPPTFFINNRRLNLTGDLNLKDLLESFIKP